MSSAFERLDKSVQNILWDMKWSKLFQFQVDTINSWFDTNKDMLIMANTAAGKTEAAFLPIISSLSENSGAGSIRVLYVGPLKALINDQFQRLEELCVKSEIQVHRWHGDVGSHKKKKLIANPNGILLITPESLEAMLIRHGRDARRIFKYLDAIVIDEMHVFLDSERGRQLLSQLNRIDKIREGLNKTRRLGLSATIGDVEIARQWLSDSEINIPVLIESKKSNDVELMLKTFIENPKNENANLMGNLKGIATGDSCVTGVAEVESALFSIAEHVLELFSNNSNLIFCNQKLQIEQLADYISLLCDKKKIANNFLVHHGSLSKEFREDVEVDLKSSKVCTAICSSTLELGIDIGNVEAVGQIDPPHGVSVLKQRMGRSGRREGQPSKLLMYIPLIACSDKSSLADKLYPKLLQAISLVQLMVGDDTMKGWIEPPECNCFDFSTLIQQTLSLIAQKGGVRADVLYESICSSIAFKVFGQELYKRVLKDMGASDLIEQIPTGEIVLGIEGERLVNNYNFYAAFETPLVYTVISKSGPVGTVDGITGFYMPEQYILLGGKRWQITDVDERNNKIFVIRAKGKSLVKWSGEAGNVHSEVRKKMFGLLKNKQLPQWLEPNSAKILKSAIKEFELYDLEKKRVLRHGNNLYVFTWTSSKANHTLELVFKSAGVNIENEDICLVISGSDINELSIERILKSFCEEKIEPALLARRALFNEIPPVGKYGIYLSDELNACAYAGKYLDVNEGKLTAEKILKSMRISF